MLDLKDSFKSISPKVKRLVTHPRISLDEPFDVSPLKPMGFPSKIDDSPRGPKVLPYYHNKNQKRNQANSKCFICQEYLHSKLIDEELVELKCGTYTHEQCILQVIYVNDSMKCYCTNNCAHLLLPKKDINMKSMMKVEFGNDNKENDDNFFTKSTDKPLISSINLSALSTTLKHNLKISSPSLKNSASSFVATPAKFLKLEGRFNDLRGINKPLPTLPLRSPQIDDLWLSPTKSNPNLPHFDNSNTYRYSTSLPEIHDSIYDHKDPIPSRTASIARNKSIFLNRLSTSTIDSTTPQIHSYKNCSIDTVKNQFIRYLMDNNNQFTYTQLIKVGTLRLIDKLSISLDNSTWQDSTVALFGNHLVVFLDTPIMMEMNKVNVELPVQSVVKLISPDSKLWLTSVMIKVIEKWVVAISDLNFQFPVEFISSSIELTIEPGKRKRQLPLSPLKSISSASSTIRGLNLNNKLSPTDLKFNYYKIDNHLRKSPLEISSSHRSLAASLSSDFDSDIDSDQDIINNILQKNSIPQKRNDDWKDLIQNVDDLISS